MEEEGVVVDNNFFLSFLSPWTSALVVVEAVGEEVEVVVSLCFVFAREVEVAAVRVETLRKMLVEEVEEEVEVAAAVVVVVVVDISVHTDRSIFSMVKVD